MVNLLRPAAPLALCVLLSACGQWNGPPFGGLFGGGQDRTPAPSDVVEPDAPVVEAALPAPTNTPDTSIDVGGQGTSAEALDTTTEAEKEAVTAVSAPASGLLGETVASLGDPTKAGFWLMTPLVKAETKGRIERTGGAVASVTLLPSGTEPGSGSQISLAAMRALDLALTDLAALKVYAE